MSTFTPSARTRTTSSTSPSSRRTSRRRNACPWPTPRPPPELPAPAAAAPAAESRPKKHAAEIAAANVGERCAAQTKTEIEAEPAATISPRRSTEAGRNMRNAACVRAGEIAGRRPKQVPRSLWRKAPSQERSAGRSEAAEAPQTVAADRDAGRDACEPCPRQLRSRAAAAGRPPPQAQAAEPAPRRSTPCATAMACA